MFETSGFKAAALAAAIALAMAATSALAAAPAANALPGQGKVAAGTIDTATTGVSTDGNTLTITLTSGPAVINWGSGTDINKTGAAGFNIGSAETVTFAGAFPVLNIDSSGSASQIFGALGAANDVYVANSNGIIVGSGGSIAATGKEIGLIGNTTFGTNAGFTGTAASLTYNGGGGDVTVQPGASLDGGTVLISGGGNVNVDLGALVGGAATLSAGLSQGAVPATPNKNANLAITGGTLVGGSIAAAGFNSAGTASNAATLDLTGTAQSVKGAFTNTGDLALDNTNPTNGTVVNQGKLTTTAGTTTFDALTNAGAYAAAGIVINSGGNLINTGSITGAGSVVVKDGSINNSGSLADVGSLVTQSDSTGTGFIAGSQDYVNNTGSITSAGNLVINVNTIRAGGADNDSTGSFTNTGTLNLGAGGALTITTNNNVSLGGTLKAGATPAVLSATNALGLVVLVAGGGAFPFTGNGALSVLTPIFAGNSALAGPQVKVMSNVTDMRGDIQIVAGAASATDYAVRVASGVTVAAAGSAILVNGDKASDNPNVILQGVLSADNIVLGSGNNVSDVFSGPKGGLVATGATPFVEFDFTGTIKTAKYLNDANFRYNYLPISAPKATSPVNLFLNPTAYTTNGTSNGLSAVNILVDGDLNLHGGAPYVGSLSGAGTAVTGVTTTPNTHLVLQSTGNISTTGGGFYWPGYVYLGTIDTNADGSAAPGTLSAGGTITLGSNFTNELPGDVAGASGIHFMSGNALVGTGQVTTNANAWINFPTDLLAQSYAQGLITTPSFFGGVATGLIVNYGKLDASSFNTHQMDATR